MILSDRQIFQRLEEGSLRIEPFDHKDVQPASVDLYAGNRFLTQNEDVDWWKLGDADMDPQVYDIPEVDPKIPGKEMFVLEPGDFALAATREVITIPNDIAARVEGCSSIGRQGLMVHITAGFIDPGYHGTITLELHNVSRRCIAIAPGDRICQLSFHQLTSECCLPYEGRYQGAKDVVPARVKR